MRAWNRLLKSPWMSLSRNYEERRWKESRVEERLETGQRRARYRKDGLHTMHPRRDIAEHM